MARNYVRGSLVERFWPKVQIGSPTDCWPWQAGLTGAGYGSLAGDVAGSKVYAHRASYEMTYGPIPDGLEVDHVCHNVDASCPGGDACAHRRCVNPDHLRAVPHAQNVAAGRRAESDTCQRGHSMDDAYVRPDGTGRTCRTCNAERASARPARGYDSEKRRAAYLRKKARA